MSFSDLPYHYIISTAPVGNSCLPARNPKRCFIESFRYSGTGSRIKVNDLLFMDIVFKHVVHYSSAAVYPTTHPNHSHLTSSHLDKWQRKLPLDKITLRCILWLVFYFTVRINYMSLRWPGLQWCNVLKFTSALNLNLNEGSTVSIKTARYKNTLNSTFWVLKGRKRHQDDSHFDPISFDTGRCSGSVKLLAPVAPGFLQRFWSILDRSTAGL